MCRWNAIVEGGCHPYKTWFYSIRQVIVIKQAETRSRPSYMILKRVGGVNVGRGCHMCGALQWSCVEEVSHPSDAWCGWHCSTLHDVHTSDDVWRVWSKAKRCWPVWFNQRSIQPARLGYTDCLTCIESAVDHRIRGRRNLSLRVHLGFGAQICRTDLHGKCPCQWTVLPHAPWLTLTHKFAASYVENRRLTPPCLLVWLMNACVGMVNVLLANAHERSSNT